MAEISRDKNTSPRSNVPQAALHMTAVKQRQRLRPSIVAFVMGLAIMAGYHIYRSNAATANITVDFTRITQQLAPGAFSGTISTYGGDGGSLAKSPEQVTRLTSLGLSYYRVPLQYNGGNIISSAGGGPTDISGDTWIAKIKATGAQPIIVLGGSKDNNFTASDAANMVRHFNTGGGSRVGIWVIGNEPGNSGMDIQTYCTLFNNSATAMKAVDPTIKVAGPAWAYYNKSNLQAFMACAGNIVDVIDYHHYGMGTTYISEAQALSETPGREVEVRETRAIINATVPARSSAIDIQVGEYNWSWRTDDGYQGYGGDDRFYQAVNTVWGASVAGHIAAAGARGHQYSDQNGALSLTFEKNADAAHFGQTVNDPMPIYYGLRMFSGGQRFRGFGTAMVSSSTTLPDVEVFASVNSKSIVLINKNSTAARDAIIAQTGANSGSVDVWQTNKSAPYAEPAKIATQTLAPTLQVSLPPYSVTTLVINESTATPTPTVAPTRTPTPTLTPTPTAVPSASPTITPIPSRRGDINKDGKVNITDLSLLLANWARSGSAADVNGDGTVNTTDLSILLSNWTG